jgi:hypothetical protein
MHEPDVTIPAYCGLGEGRDQMAHSEQINGRERMVPDVRFDVTVPNVARIYDYLLGGKDNFHGDRDAAVELYKLLPDVAQACRQNREFLRRAVRYLAGQAGIDQFIDIGSSLQTVENTHQIAQEIRPGARVVYADNDPVVVAHARVLLASSPDVAVIDADLRRPGTITANPALLELVDPSGQVAFLLVAVLHFIQDSKDPYGIVNVLRSVMAPGSYVVISQRIAYDIRHRIRCAACGWGRAGFDPGHPGGCRSGWAGASTPPSWPTCALTTAPPHMTAT